MTKILLGLKSKSASFSGTSSYGFECGSIQATQVDIVMSGTETEIRTFVNSAREERKQLTDLADYIERLEDMERWEDIDEVRETYDKINLETQGVNYDKLIMVDGIEL